jgi:hypothetical protein
MAKRLYSFPMTPEAEDERDAVCEMLSNNHIEHYETPGSNWGFSKAGVWIKDDDDFDRAKQLFAQHQQNYAAEARKRYQEETGYNPNAGFKESVTFLLQHMARRKQALPLLLIALVLLYLYIEMFFGLFSS